MIGELARRSVVKQSNTVRLLRYNSHICHSSDINTLFKAYCCLSCHQIIKRAQHLERHLNTCEETAKHIFPQNMYQLRETLFDKLNSFNIPYSVDQELFENVAIINFESICVQEDKFQDTETTTWISKHIPIYVSISSNLTDHSNSLCSSNS